MNQKKFLVLLMLTIISISTVFSTESKLAGMAGISKNRNNFLPNFWADTLMVNPAFAVYLKAKWGFSLDNTFSVGVNGDNNKTNTSVKDTVDAMFLFNFDKFMFGIGGDGVSVGVNADTEGNVSVPVSLGAKFLFAFNVSKSFKFGIDFSFFSHSFTTTHFVGDVTPGFMWFVGNNRISLAIPIEYAYVGALGLKNDIKFGAIFVDDIQISDKLTLRIPARVDFSIRTDGTTVEVDAPFSGGISASFQATEQIEAFIGADLGIAPSNFSNSNTSSAFKIALAPSLSAGVEGTILPWFTLRAGLSADILKYSLESYSNGHTKNTFVLFSNPAIVTGATFKVWKALRIDVASEFQYLGSTVYWETPSAAANRGDFQLVLRAGISLFSD